MPRPATKRNDIISTALRLFAEKGVKATTIRDIAAAAGVTEGALYRHFAGKEELARYLFAGSAELFYDHLARALEGLTGARERLQALVCGFFGFAESNPEVFGYVMARHYGGLGAIPATTRLPKMLFVAALREGMTNGELRSMDPELAAALVIGMASQAILFLQNGAIAEPWTRAQCEVCQAVSRIFDPTE